MKENEGLFFTEPDLYSMVDYKWMAGNSKRLNEPNTCVLNESLATEFFGDWKKAMGQTIHMWSFGVPLLIVGVFKDLPHNTDLEVKMGASYETLVKLNAGTYVSDDWTSAAWPRECFLLLPQGVKPGQFKTQLQTFVKNITRRILKGTRKSHCHSNR